MGLGQTLITFGPGATIKSADANANNAALNGATTPSFQTVTLQQPPILAAGSAETGVAGGALYFPGSGIPEGVAANFKTVCARTPTSCSWSGDVLSTNSNTPGMNNLTPYGFLALWQANAAGTGACFGHYTVHC